MSSKRLILSYKRKRKGKTDYKKRLGLLKSNKLRFVVRRSLKNILIQIIKYEDTGDKVLISLHSNQLKKLGWKFHKGNTPAAYLTGLLCGIKAKKQDINEAILDLGLSSSIKNSVCYAAIKGALDAGLKIPVSKEVLPQENRVDGEFISKDINQNFNEIKNKILQQK